MGGGAHGRAHIREAFIENSFDFYKAEVRREVLRRGAQERCSSEMLKRWINRQR
jgi:predicted DNA-binding protein